MKRVLVVGAGASGLMAAISAARAGAAVTILEAMEKPGKKLLMTGNGRCNLTNMDEHLPEAYRGKNPAYALPAVKQFDAGETRAFFTSLGLLTIEKNGYVYPLTNQASSVLEVLLAEVRRLEIKLKLSEKVERIRKEGAVWKAATSTWEYEADALILACGSRCVPATGSDGSGYRLAEMAGLSRVPEVPALVPVICEEKFLPRLAGVRCQAMVTLQESSSGRRIGQERGEVQWTKYGISGIAVFQLSRYVAYAKRPGKYEFELDLLPDFDFLELSDLIRVRAGQLSNEKAAVLLAGLLPEKLIPIVLEQAKIPAKKKCAGLSGEDLSRILSVCRAFPLHPSGTKEFDSCQVCAGGVDTALLNPETMECRDRSGLYLTGELVDIDGPCGGYNLQWAWSSGYAAGRAAAG